MRSLSTLTLIAVLLTGVLTASARDYKDTLQSANGDRLILDYSVTQSGGKLTVKFSNVMKKLGQQSLDKYKKVDKVAAVFFDRTGTYNDMSFDGMAPNAFMVPADLTYTASADGYFLLQDNPTLQFTATGNAQFEIPIYLAYYKKKQQYELFSQVGSIKVKTTDRAASGGGTGGQQGGAEVITTEELIDEGMSPADEALIRMDMLRNMLGSATKVTEELTHEAAQLRDLSAKITDESVRKQITDLLKVYDQKKQELEEQAEAQQKAEAAAAAQAQMTQQEAMMARQDSIQAARDEKEAEKSEKMMWIIGGIAAVTMLFMGSKQVFQMIKNNKMQKQIADTVRKAQETQQQMLGGPNSPLGQMAAKGQREARKILTKEGEAAKQRLEALRKGNTKPEEQPKPAQPKKPSLNDVIPKKYKRWGKTGNTDNNNVTI